MSKSMLNSAIEKIKLERKSAIRFGLVAVCVLMLLLPFFVQSQKTTKLSIGARQYYLDVASDEATMQKGLSGRKTMASDHGMLFVFAKTGNHCFWMKDMNFPIDIIWLDDDKSIVYIETDVSPSTYPSSFCPGKPARYVIELLAGEAVSTGMSLGQKLKF